MDCKTWLREYLSQNAGHSEYIRDEAENRGFTKRQLRDARKELGVKTYHQFDEDGATQNWFWYIDAN